MLNEIRVSPVESATGPVAMLLDCHERIRHFAHMATRLTEDPSAPPEQIYCATEGLVRYFTVALPLHEADENESIFPRLCDAVPADDIVAKSAKTMVRQHQAIEELLQSLLPLWQAVQSQPIDLRQLAPELKQLTKRLQLHFAAHLAMEEDVIFPAVEKLLSPGQRHEIEAEMRARRKIET
jgi:iron-sulfur cluster repair protein YtfE (RIC family)